MKRILSILSLLFIINACDDGDMKVENIDFSEVAVQKCSLKDILYKVKDSEMLILTIPSTVFPSDQTPTNTPITIPISNTNQVIYRQYNGAASEDNLCPTVPSATPNLMEEWIASSGTIQITTTAIYTTNPTTNGTRISQYKHYIVFKNITFQTPNGEQTYETYVFGNYSTTATALAFGFGDETEKSGCDDRIFNFGGSEVLILDTGSNFATLFENTATTTPRTDVINSTNKLTYRLYTNSIDNAFLCATPIPLTPTLSQEWNAVAGVTGLSGIIEVSTSPLAGDFQHTIRLKKVSFTKGNSSFYLGDDILYGTLITSP